MNYSTYRVFANGELIADNSGLGNDKVIFDAELYLTWQLGSSYLDFSIVEKENSYYNKVSLYDTISVYNIYGSSGQFSNVVFSGYIDTISTDKDLVKKIHVVGMENLAKFMNIENVQNLGASVPGNAVRLRVTQAMSISQTPGSDFLSLWPNNEPPGSVSLLGMVNESVYLKKGIEAKDIIKNNLYDIIDNHLAESGTGVRTRIVYGFGFATISIVQTGEVSTSTINSSTVNIKDIELIDGYDEYFNTVVPYTSEIYNPGTLLNQVPGFNVNNDQVITTSFIREYGRFCRRGNFVYSRDAYDRGEKPIVKFIEVNTEAEVTDQSKGYEMVRASAAAIYSSGYIRNLKMNLFQFTDDNTSQASGQPQRWINYNVNVPEIGATNIISTLESLKIKLFEPYNSELKIGRRPDPITKRIEKK